MSKFKLEPWSELPIEFDESAHCYKVNDCVKLGPSQLMGLCGLGLKLDEMGETQRGNIERAGQLGKIVHRWCEIIDLGQENDFEPPPERIKPYIEAWKKFVKDYKVEMLEIEKPHYHPEQDYVGTIDRVCVIGGELYVLDIKTAKKVNGNGKIQLCAYANFFKNKISRIIVQPREDGTYKVYDDSGKHGIHYMEQDDFKNWDAVLRICSIIRKKS